MRDAETQACSDRCTYLAIDGHVAAHEAEAMALEEELSRSTPPDGVVAPDGDLEAATQAASTNQNPIDLRNGWSHGEWNGWAAEDEGEGGS